MRIVRDEGFIKKRTQFTQRGSLLGMGLLLVALLTSTRNPLISWLFLLTGFVVAMAAVRVGNRYVRPPRPDTVLDKVLKGLDNKYALYHYVLPAEHLLLTPSGLIAIMVRPQHGKISVRGGRWRQGSFWQRMRIFLGESPLGNPGRDLGRQISATNEALGERQEGDDALPLDGVIVFHAAKTELDVEDPEYPVVLAENLKATIRTLAESHPPLPAPARKELSAWLKGENAAAEAGTGS